MRAMYLTKNSGIWYLITGTSLLLVIGGLITLISSILARRNKGNTWSPYIARYWKRTS